MNAQLFNTSTVRSGEEPGKTYTSVMSDAGFSSTSGVSWWSEPRARRITPAAARHTANTVNENRCFIAASGLRGFPNYAGGSGPDWCPRRLVGRGDLPDEERLLGGLGRAARRLFRHGAQLERETGWHRHGGGDAAIGRGVEHPQAHGFALGDGPQLIGAARRGGRQPEHRHHHPPPRRAPVQPGGGRLTGSGERRGADVGRQQRGDERIARRDRVARGRERGARPSRRGTLPQVAVAETQRDDQAGGGREPRRERPPGAANRTGLPRSDEHT